MNHSMPLSTQNFDCTGFGCTGQCNYSYIKLIDYKSRWYSASLGRFSQPDSIVPDLSNTQAWNRFSYSYNNPVMYNDPTGHVPEGENETERCLPGSYCYPDLPGGGGSGSNGSGNNGDQSGKIVEDLEGAEEGITLPGGWKITYDKPMIVCVTVQEGDICIVVMPPGTESNVISPMNYADDVAFFGGFLDILETIFSGGAAFFPPAAGVADLISVGDVLVTGGACYMSGECYLGDPGFGLPPMLVGNSDILVTVADLIIGTATTPVGDFFTSGASIVWDFGRASGEIHNSVSVGVSVFTPGNEINMNGVVYIIVYPK